MRIAMLSYHTCPLATLGGKDTGGMNVYVRDLVKELGRQGVGVDVFTRSQDEHVPHVLHHLGYGNRIVHVPAGPEIPLEKDQLARHVPQYTDWILEFTRDKNLIYDLVHSHYWLSGLAAMSLREAWSSPFIQTFHTLAEMKSRIARSESESPSELRIQAERQLLLEADRIIVSTQAEMAQIQWLYQTSTSHVDIIPPGVDISRFYPIPDDEAREFVGIEAEVGVLLFVGRIEPLKGIDSLLEALAILHHRELFDPSKLRLMIIGGEVAPDPEGRSEEMARLQELSDSLGVGETVTFLGKRDQDTLQYYYSLAEVVVMPSHYESFGMVALEAMACGTPVVASEIGGLSYLVQDGQTGFHVPAGDPVSLADKLQILLADKALRDRFGKQAVEYARQYNWTDTTKKVLATYHRVLEGR